MSILVQVASFSVQLDARTRRGPVAFSLTNTGAVAATLRLVPLALSPELGGCLTPDPVQVTLAPGTTTMVLMQVAAPNLLAAGAYLVRLSLVPVAGGAGVSSSDVTVLVPARPTGPSAEARPQPFPWWIVIVGGILLLLIVGLVLWLTLGGDGKPEKAAGEPPKAEAEPAEPAARPPVKRPEVRDTLENAKPAEHLEKAPERAAEVERPAHAATAAEAAKAANEKSAPASGKGEKTIKPEAAVQVPTAPPTSRPTIRPTTR